MNAKEFVLGMAMGYLIGALSMLLVVFVYMV